MAAKRPSVLVQELRIARFQFHSGDAIWPSLKLGNMLALVREPSNKHDPNAIAVYAQNDKLGYVPRAENSTIAQMLDRGERLEAKISELSMDEDPWKRVRITIFLV